MKASVASKKKSGANRNVSYNTSSGGSVSIKNGVKTYSGKPNQVTGKNGISISGQDYSRNKGGTGFAPITPQSLTMPPAPPNVPPPAPFDPGNMVGANNTALAGGLSGFGVSPDGKGGFKVAPPPDATTGASGVGSAADIFKQYIEMRSGIQPESKEGIYNKLYKESGKKKAQEAVNNYTAQLNSIVAKRDADILSVEGQGRGITEAIIGGQQAQLNKEAAIKALPVQAQLAAAQGNLEMASEYLNTMFTIKSADADARFKYQTGLLDAYYDFATKQEQRQFDDLKEQKAQKYQAEQNLLSTQNQLMQMALSNRAPKAVQDAILAARDTASAIQAAGVYGTDMLGREAQLANIAQSRASAANSYDAIAARAEASKMALGTLNGKAQTQTEKQIEGYANRLTQANAVINQLGNQFASKSSVFGEYAPNLLKSEDRQMFEQAQRNFINSVLRRESGAVISEQEFTNARLQYFPQPGDSAGVLAQKAQNRGIVISTFYNEGNVPMPAAVDATQPLQPGFKGVTTSGLSYTIQ